MKIFENKKYDVKGHVLSKDDFKLARDEQSYTIDPKRVEKILEKAEESLVKPIPMLTLSMYRNYLEEGSTTVYGAPYRERMEMAMQLFVAEYVTDSGKYIDKLADVIWAMLDESTWMLPEHTPHNPAKETQHHKVPGAVGDKYPHGLELGSAYRSSLIAIIHHFMKDKLDAISPLISERIVYELKRRTIDTFLNYKFWWMGTGGNKVNNWCPWIISNVLLTVSLVEEDMDRREKTVELALEYLDNFINWYPEDGGCEEGPTYWNAGAACFYDCLELLDDMTDGYVSIFDDPLVKAMGEYAARVNICDNYFVNFADSRSTARFNAEMLRRYGRRCNSDIIYSLGNAMNESNAWFDTAISYRTFRSLITPMAEACDFKPHAALETYLPHLKIMALRDSEIPNEGFFFAMKGGHNNESHNHNDVGSFIVYRNGKPVLIDVGVGTYTRQTFSADRYKIWSMQSLYHNLPSFGGIGQHQGENFASKNEIYDAGNRSLTLDLTNAYETDCGLVSYVRRGSLNNGVITLNESVKLDGDRDIDFIFVTHREPKLLSGRRISLAENCVLEYDDGLVAEIEEFDPVGLNAEIAWGTEKMYRIHLKAHADAIECAFRVIQE